MNESPETFGANIRECIQTPGGDVLVDICVTATGNRDSAARVHRDIVKSIADTSNRQGATGQVTAQKVGDVYRVPT